MFQWATEQFDKISQTVAPPPTDGAGRFAFACQRLDEETALGCIAEIDPLSTVVNQSKGYFPIHLASQFSMTRLIQLLMQQPGMNIEQPDYSNNTPLHHACMSSQRGNALAVVKLLINDYGASVLAKNAQGQTPYDVASLDSVRQYLLPIQLQKETQIALDNGGIGLPPGIDMGGLRIKNSAVPPPPKFGEGGIPIPNAGANMTAAPNQQRYAATPNYASPPPAAGQPYHQQPAAPSLMAPAPASAPYVPSPAPAQQVAPMSGSTTPVAPPAVPAPSRGRYTAATSTGSVASSESGYSRTGGSSLAVFSTKYRADGFHSSSSDVSLQKKYGHTNISNTAMPAPPSSGNAAPLSGGVPNVPGSNPFGGGYRPGSLYVAYGSAAAAAPASGPAYSSPYSSTASPATKYFTPGVAAPAPATSTPIQAAPTTPFMPPPPYQTQNYAALVASPTPVVMTPSAAATVSTPSPSTAAAAFETPHPATPAASPPVETAAKVFQQQPESKMETTLQEQSTATAEATSASSVASSEWVETVDPSSGKSYYYNSKTNETSWTKPTETVSGADDSAPSSDWTEAADPTSGNTYYYNTKTGETSWEKPAALEAVAEKATSDSGEQIPTAEERKEEKPDSDSAPGNGVEPNQVEEPPSNETVVEPAATVEKPKAAEGKEEEHSGESPEIRTLQEESTEMNEPHEKPPEDTPKAESITNDTEPEQTPVVAESKIDSFALPDDWVEVPDPSSGRSYYYNSKTQETSWERPSMSSAEPSTVKPAVALAEGWVEVQDPNTGNTYYFNQSTNETSWEKPLAQSADSLDGSSDWVETMDPSSGKYYYNSKTGETSWEKPAALVTTEAVKDAASESVVTEPAIAVPTPATLQPAVVERQKSAEELFSDGPPTTAGVETEASLTPEPSTSTRPDFISPAAATFGSPETPALSVGSESVESVFGSPTVNTPASTGQSVGSVLGSGPSEVVEPAVGVGEPANEPLNESNDTEGEMMDVPLSPEPVSKAAPTPADEPSEPPSTKDTNPPAGNDLFAAIGMPPPPFQSK